MTDSEKLDLILYHLEDMEKTLDSMRHTLCIIRIREDTVYMEQLLLHADLEKLCVRRSTSRRGYARPR